MIRIKQIEGQWKGLNSLSPNRRNRSWGGGGEEKWLCLQVALSVEGTGEGDVIQGAGGGIGSSVPGHAGDAVLCLLGWQLPAKLVHCDVVLEERRRD